MRWMWVGCLMLVGWTACSGSSTPGIAIPQGGTGPTGGAGDSSSGRDSGSGGDSGSGVPLTGGTGTGATGGTVAGSAGTTSGAGEGGMGGVPVVDYACLTAEDEAGAPSAYLGDAAWSCECQGREYCDTSATSLCLKGLPCPTTLDDIRHGLACAGAGDGVYAECENGTAIQWGSTRTDLLPYADVPTATFPSGLLQATFSNDGALAGVNVTVKNPEPGRCNYPPYPLLSWALPANPIDLSNCRSCQIGHTQTCIVDRYGRIALPPLGSGGSGGSGGSAGTGGMAEGGALSGGGEGGA